MKFIYIIITVYLLFPSTITGQQASDYFPANTGFKWLYEVTPLDSLNNPVNSQVFFKVDSFTTTVNYEGKLANVVISKEGSADLINVIPYNDSSYYHFAGADGFEYINIGRIELFLTALDSIVADSNFSFLEIFNSFEDWYSTYRFGAIVNDKYALFSVDTSVVINNVDVPLRFEYNAVRLEDDTLDTRIGTFVCKKFFRERGISFLILPPPPIPPIPVPIAFFNDTIWVAENNWIVQSILPGTNVDLGIITGDTLTVPGLQILITDEISGIIDEEYIPQKFDLTQNYPNPFNPATTIRFEIVKSGPVKLKVVDILGNEITTLVDEVLPTGLYSIVFDAAGLPSGFYVYTLESGGLSVSKKMMLLK